VFAITHVVSLDGVVGAISDAVEYGGAVARVLPSLERLVDRPGVDADSVEQMGRVDRNLQYNAGQIGCERATKQAPPAGTEYRARDGN
jgi:hypothetical protein